MSKISNLPEEVINIILSNNEINIKDVINMSTTCKLFYNIVKQSGNKFWQRKFHQRWPKLKKIYKKKLRRKHINYKELIKTGTKCKTRLRSYLTHMNKKWYSIYENQERYLRQRSHYKSQKRDIYNKIPVMISADVNQQDLDFLIDKKNDEHSLNYNFLMDELKSLFKEPKRNKYTNELTNIFYGKKLLPYLKHYHLKNVWQKFINRPAKQQLLEEAAIFVMQWCRPEEDISYSHIKMELDNCALQAMESLRIENPRHPIFSVSHEQFSFWKCNNIDEDQWDKEDARQILCILCKILKSKIYYIISQAIVFHAVARRLGVCCYLIRLSEDIFGDVNLHLIWKPKYINRNNNYDECSFLIHVSHGVEMFIKTHSSSNHYVTMILMNNSTTMYRLNSVQFINMLLKCIDKKNIQHEYKEIWLLELQVLIKPKKIKRIKKLYNMYCNRWMDVSPVIIALEKIIDDGDIRSRKIKSTKLFLNDVLREQKMTSKLLHKIRCTKPKPKRRKPEMKFAVGMIVNLKDRNEERVIIGWERLRSNDLLLNNYYSSLSYTIPSKHKIFYSVSRDLIKPLICKFRTIPIDHKDVGKYFCQYNDYFYMPNEMMRKEYEEDVLFLINKYVDKCYFSSSVY